jgi:DNA-binding NarL/FixJ family response regulator
MKHTRIRILLADDQQEMLEAVARLLEDEFDVIAAVTTGERVIEAALRLAPDLLVLDISMPVLNGIEAAACLKESGSRAKVIFLTVNADPDIVEMALSIGALGYVLKPHLAADLIPAIRQVLQDRVFVSPAMPIDKNRLQQSVVI